MSEINNNNKFIKKEIKELYIENITIICEI